MKKTVLRDLVEYVERIVYQEHSMTETYSKLPQKRVTLRALCNSYHLYSGARRKTRTLRS